MLVTRKELMGNNKINTSPNALYLNTLSYTKCDELSLLRIRILSIFEDDFPVGNVNLFKREYTLLW